jgi:hypothetical protein
MQGSGPCRRPRRDSTHAAVHLRSARYPAQRSHAMDLDPGAIPSPASDRILSYADLIQPNQIPLMVQLIQSCCFTKEEGAWRISVTGILCLYRGLVVKHQNHVIQPALCLDPGCWFSTGRCRRLGTAESGQRVSGNLRAVIWGRALE